jgi:hypothetical protein
MASANQYPKLGDLTVVPSADLTSATSAANRKSPARLGDQGFGKRAGMIVVRDAGGGDLRLVFATGSAPTDVWKVVDNSATYTPS